MSNINPPNNMSPVLPIKDPLSLHDLVKLLIKHYDIHEGHYDLSIEFQISLGAMGATPENILPSAMIGLKRVGLTPSGVIGPLSVDASIVNPVKVKTKKKSVEK
ncbi:MAG: hypothetical protein P4L42_03365 [Desulfocapsaceae bacterium]|nr:hypothetical protein [Desulfocapsaceae bacterium]